MIEAYLHVKVQNPAPTEQLPIKRNGSTVFVLQPTPQDAVLVDTALTQGARSEEAALEVVTLLPTSHDFAWETTLLGDGNCSRLVDVATINDTLAYAVGEMT